MGDIKEVLRANYPRLAGQIFAPMLDVLHSARAACNHDLEAFIVLSTVILRTVEHEQFAQLSADELADLRPEHLPGLGTNLRSIADSTGIPRETVRRKMSVLVEAGWVERRGGELYCTPTVFRDLAPVRESVLRMLERHHRMVVSLVEET